MNRNSTASILVSRAKVGKMQKFQSSQIKPFAPSIPLISQRNANQFPELPKLIKRSGSGTLMLPYNSKQISKEAKNLKEILMRPPSQSNM